MAALVQSLILKRFRSIPSTTIALDNPTFLVGRNGAGKSNIADAFSFLAEAMASPLSEVFDRRGGIGSVRNRTSGKSFPPNLGLAVVFGRLQEGGGAEGQGSANGFKHARYAFEIGALPKYEFEVVREQCVVTSTDGSRVWFDRRKGDIQSNLPPLRDTKGGWLTPGALAMPILGGVRPFVVFQQLLKRMSVYAIEPSALREMQDPDNGATLRIDGRNAASVLEEIEKRAPTDKKRIEEILSAVVPNTTEISTVQLGKKLSLEFTQEWGDKKRIEFEAFNMSDGTLRALGMLLAVFQKTTPSLIFVEEPEASIHPGAAGALLDTLRHASSRMQVIVSTHSPELLDAKWIEDRHLRVVAWREGATRVENVSETAKSALRDHLMGAGELLRSEALEPEFELRSQNQSDLALFEDI